LIIIGCYNLDTNNFIDSLTSEAVNYDTQTSRWEYLPARNLFTYELLAVSISCSAVSRATDYSTFLEQTCNGVDSLDWVNNGGNLFNPNMLLFWFTGHVVELANAKGINPVFEGDPEYFGFSQEEVDRCGYFPSS
jgi:hypothetical protein